MFKRQAEAANDWRTDKELNEACQVLILSHPVSIAAGHIHMAWLCDLCHAQHLGRCLKAKPMRLHLSGLPDSPAPMAWRGGCIVLPGPHLCSTLGPQADSCQA